LPVTSPQADVAEIDAEPENGVGHEYPPRSLLYVEDNASNLRLVEQILARRPSFSLQSAIQGRMALELAATHDFDLILLDLDLPDMPGIDVLQSLRADERTAAVPIVIVSADATPGQQEKLLEAGAAAYVTKPLDVPRFLKTLDRVLDAAPVK
jgi:CheY-like chemotaxis protein